MDLSRFDDAVGGREIAVEREGLDIYECARAVLGSYTVQFRHRLGSVVLRECETAYGHQSIRED
jgi:hypothetical protein